MKFIYSADGEVVGLSYKDKSYYYVKNLQGDVIAILDEYADIICEYTYDAWGKCSISIPNGSGANIVELANKNPIRYRGYYYDTETNLYYLQSRYYNPEWCRFVNEDELLCQSTLRGNNLFTYCFNNPINYVDFSGMVPDTVLLANAQAYANGGNIAMCGYANNTSSTSNDRYSVSTIDKNSPPDHPNYTPPKKGGGKKVKNPNGQGWGWPAKDGGVWIPDTNMHGGEGWTIQYPSGGHSHAYPGGGVRNHFQTEQPTRSSVVMIFSGALLTVGFIIDDITGVGVANDPLIVGSMSCFVGGLNGVCGKKTCSVCGGVKYGY